MKLDFHSMLIIIIYICFSIILMSWNCREVVANPIAARSDPREWGQSIDIKRQRDMMG
uniref:Hypotheticial protein n=1 Tax=Schistosoma japonicum TaxID=6182 RepID=C1L6E2_SCHJA|nr:hypotheticial protein [Schistosoma japonicum]CAX70271.1 hypotheticial protein [Schistosoma japonicum]CAX74836.1 hypotheticial protein [Schistosoma japonicum]